MSFFCWDRKYFRRFLAFFSFFRIVFVLKSVRSRKISGRLLSFIQQITGVFLLLFFWYCKGCQHFSSIFGSIFCYLWTIVHVFEPPQQLSNYLLLFALFSCAIECHFCTVWGTTWSFGTIFAVRIEVKIALLWHDFQKPKVALFCTRWCATLGDIIHWVALP